MSFRFGNEIIFFYWIWGGSQHNAWYVHPKVRSSLNKYGQVRTVSNAYVVLTFNLVFLLFINKNRKRFSGPKITLLEFQVLAAQHMKEEPKRLVRERISTTLKRWLPRRFVDEGENWNVRNAKLKALNELEMEVQTVLTEKIMMDSVWRLSIEVKTKLICEKFGYICREIYFLYVYNVY